MENRGSTQVKDSRAARNTIDEDVGSLAILLKTEAAQDPLRMTAGRLSQYWGPTLLSLPPLHLSLLPITPA